MTTTTTFDLDAVKAAVDREGVAGLSQYLAEDVEWTEIDQKTPPSSPAVTRGRKHVLDALLDSEGQGIVSRIADGFVAGNRAALELRCKYPSGGQVVQHAMAELRGGQIARYSGVQAWDE